MKKIPDIISYELLSDAKNFFLRHGYVYKEVPWIVPHTTLSMTRPKDVVPKKDNILHSGEQGFLQLILENRLNIGMFQTITPCHRPEDVTLKDDIHFSQFSKLELMWYKGAEKPSSSLPQVIAEQVCNYLKNWPLKVRFRAYKDESRECLTESALDIEIECNGSWLEYGSYGIRMHEKIGWWVFGTGIAEPRFTQILKKCKHNIAT